MIDHKSKYTVFGVSGQIRVQGDTYAVTATVESRTRLGKQIVSNETARAVAANYIRQALGLRRGTPSTIVHWRLV